MSSPPAAAAAGAEAPPPSPVTALDDEPQRSPLQPAYLGFLTLFDALMQTPRDVQQSWSELLEQIFRHLVSHSDRALLRASLLQQGSLSENELARLRLFENEEQAQAYTRDALAQAKADSDKVEGCVPSSYSPAYVYWSAAASSCSAVPRGGAGAPASAAPEPPAFFGAAARRTAGR